jgi:hypothetical protein
VRGRFTAWVFRGRWTLAGKADTREEAERLLDDQAKLSGMAGAPRAVRDAIWEGTGPPPEPRHAAVKRPAGGRWLTRRYVGDEEG